MSDPMMLAGQLLEAVESEHLEGLGAVQIEGTTVALWWRGEVPATVTALIAASDTAVDVRSCRFTEKELTDAVQALTDAWRRLPFCMVRVGVTPGAAGVDVGVAEPELSRARRYFEEHPLLTPDGAPVPVHLGATGYPAVTTFPLHPRTADELRGVDLERYVGLPLDDATHAALRDGWLVRSYETELDVALTLDLRKDRLNLEHSRDGVVTSAHAG